MSNLSAIVRPASTLKQVLIAMNAIDNNTSARLTLTSYALFVDLRIQHPNTHPVITRLILPSQCFHTYNFTYHLVDELEVHLGWPLEFNFRRFCDDILRADDSDIVRLVVSSALLGHGFQFTVLDHNQVYKYESNINTVLSESVDTRVAKLRSFDNFYGVNGVNLEMPSNNLLHLLNMIPVGEVVDVYMKLGSVTFVSGEIWHRIEWGNGCRVWNWNNQRSVIIVRLVANRAPYFLQALSHSQVILMRVMVAGPANNNQTVLSPVILHCCFGHGFILDFELRQDCIFEPRVIATILDV